MVRQGGMGWDRDESGLTHAPIWKQVELTRFHRGGVGRGGTGQDRTGTVTGVVAGRVSVVRTGWCVRGGVR